METVSNNGVRKEIAVGPVQFDGIRDNSEFQKKGTKTLQIRQVITTQSFYPSKKVTNDMQENLFGTSDFGFEEQVFTSEEQRVAWMPVPENATEEAIKAKLEAANGKGCCIYKVLSHEPILSDDQEYAIGAGLRTKDQFADAQALRYPENEETIADGTAGKLILHNGLVQYRRTYFWGSQMEDHDARSSDKVYLSANLKAELEGASVMKGQTI